MCGATICSTSPPRSRIGTRPAAGCFANSVRAPLLALKALHRGTVAEASLRRGFSGLFPGTSPGRIVTGRVVYKLGARASELGMSEDGILGITDNGELVRMSRWLGVEGQRPIDPRGQSRRFRDRLARKAKSLGCEGLMSVTAVEAHGEPQREMRFNKEYESVFYLDATGRDHSCSAIPNR